MLKWVLMQLIFTYTAFSIRDDIGFQVQECRTTAQGRYLIADDSGYVCDAISVDSESRCCPKKGNRFSCQGCNLISQCCNSYELCVSCCLDPVKTRRELAVQTKIAKAATAGTYSSVFDFCAGRCRHNSESVGFHPTLLLSITEFISDAPFVPKSSSYFQEYVHENAYVSDFHHCYYLPSNSSGSSDKQMESKLVGVNIVVGRQGESCDSVCKSRGQSCVPSRLLLLNECEIMQKYLNCKGGCIASMGSDQPAEVVDDAPNNLYPGACLYTKSQKMFSCDGLHKHTRRLCPCA